MRPLKSGERFYIYEAAVKVVLVEVDQRDFLLVGCEDDYLNYAIEKTVL